jgi:PAS domain S-box-containing protein
MLIAQHQLESVSRQVGQSAQPVIVADATGRILLTNDAFEKLLSATHPHLQRLEDLPALFSAPLDFRSNLEKLMRAGRPWRGEVALEVAAPEEKPLAIRADPVFSSPDKVLGFVLLFTDLTERKRAEAARRRFQQRVIEGGRRTPVRFDSHDDLVYQSLLSLLVENAQLAALEVTYGVDIERMPVMLESLRSSVGRTAELLERLIIHSSRVNGGTR